MPDSVRPVDRLVTTEDAVTIDLRDEVVLHRSALKGAMSRFEGALASPAGANGDRWLRDTTTSLAALNREVERHIEFHEGVDSFHQEILRQQPHLEPRINRLQREHLRARQLMAEIMAALETAEQGVVLTPDAAEVRMLGAELLLLLVHHRQRGADLVWDSVNLDLGLGD